MARTGRAFPQNVIIGQRQALAVPQTVTTRLITPQVVAVIDETAPRRHVHGSVIQNRWAGYQWVGLPPVPPLPKQVIQDVAQFVAETRTPERRTHITTNRWPGYQWVGLPPVTPLPDQIVVQTQSRQREQAQHRHGQVIAPRVITQPVVTVTPPKTVSVVLAAEPQERQQKHRGDVIAEMVQTAASVPAPPVVTPLPRQVVVLRAATPRLARGGHITAPRTISAPVTPPRPVTVVDLCPATIRRRGGSHVIIGRPVTAPVTPPRPTLVRAVQRRRQRTGIVRVGHGFGAGPVQSAISQAALTGYVQVGAQDGVTAGATGQPGVGANADPVAGATGQPGVGGSGIVNL